MSVSDIALMTVIKIKALTTSFFNKTAKLFFGAEFFRRSRRLFIACLSVWLVVNAVGYFIYSSTVSNTKNDFYQQGTSAAADLATKSGPFVLEKDILALNVEIRELEKIKNLTFAAILDHENVILAKTGSEIMDRTFDPLKNQTPVATADDTAIIADNSTGKSKVISFLKNITFSNVEIGKVYIALSTANFYASLHRARTFYLSGIFLFTILIGGVLFTLDRAARFRIVKTKRELESMTRLGPYVLKEKVAQGGMAELFLADYVRGGGFRKKAAVKRILPHLAENKDFINMFTREARVAALLQHPNVVQIFDYGKIEKAYFIAMEFIDGKNLGEVISSLEQGLPIDNAIFIISETCKGLNYSHTRHDDETRKPLNIVHRDISPQNILISYQGEVKITDFGISKASSEPSFTQAGVIKGKLAYLSPEQVLGKPVDHRADIYALGLVFHEMLTGKRVYEFDTDFQAIRAIPKMEIEPLIDLIPEVPEELNRIVMKCLEKETEQRYQSASALYAELAAFKKEQKMSFDGSDLVAFMKKHFKE
ncbi:MAG: serine/threonine protein kinase [Deltaproteobacteria bacterium]|nr:serine/threonine protein kinase [Deltaproteobacteria bacterium]